MSFYEDLTAHTERERGYLQQSSAIQHALNGVITRETYIAFLTQAFHHVRHTVPLLMAVGSRLSPRHEWLQEQVVHYLQEEQGHEQWILADIRASGGDAEAARRAPPALATDAMVAYAYDMVMRRNPVGFFGMVFVLEGTSAALALRAADQIQGALQLPPRAFTYLRSHGQLDQEHVRHLRGILERLDTAEDRDAVVRCAKAVFWLYGNVFRSLEPAAALRKAV